VKDIPKITFSSQFIAPKAGFCSRRFGKVYYFDKTGSNFVDEALGRISNSRQSGGESRQYASQISMNESRIFFFMGGEGHA
jgi:hypothetical protein